MGLVVVWFLGLVVAWWLVFFGCCGGFLVVLVVAEAVAIVFDGCLVHLDMGWWVLIMFYGFDSHRGYGCSVWWVF